MIHVFTRRAPKVSASLEEAELARILRNNMCAFLLFAIAYFLINTLFYRVGGDPGLIPALSALTLLACIGFWFANRRKASLLRLEITSHVLGLLFVANCLLDIALAFRPIKMMPLLLLLPAFAVSGARPRAVIPSSLLAIAGFMAAAWRYDRADFTDYVWVAFAGIIVGLGLAGVIRASMLNAVRAKLAADGRRDEALSLAAFDALTGLANRRAFLKQVETRLNGPQDFYLGLIDLDGFKPINDVYGHAAGDLVLAEVARRLSKACGPKAFVARLGGDEFAVILTQPADDAAWRAQAEAISDSLAQPYAIGAETAHLSASLGFAWRDGRDGEATSSRLLERADYALYEAKARGRGATVLFDAHHENLIRSTKTIEQALRGIDVERELSLAFQPQYDLVAGRTVAFEALARWNSAKLGMVSPDVFIRAAERSGLITSLTPVLLGKALAAAADWPEQVRLAFNLSARDILSPSAARRLADIVTASKMRPDRIEFEITETAMLTDFAQARRNIDLLRGLGCRVALDDFGSGYTNFSYINRIHVDTVKIDRAFVLELSRGDKARKIIKSMVELAANLGMEHVIEGVETHEELHQIRLAGGRQIQGYLFGKPMREDEIRPFLQQEAAATSPRLKA